jgi:hypothetical protein
MSQEKVEVVRRAIDAYNRRDFEAMRALGRPDVELTGSEALRRRHRSPPSRVVETPANPGGGRRPGPRWGSGRVDRAGRA